MPLYTKKSSTASGILLHFDKQTLYIEKKVREEEESRISSPTRSLSTSFPPLFSTPPSAVLTAQMAAPTSAELAQMLLDLGVAMGNLTVQVATLTTAATTSANTSS